jgi:insulysin
MKIIKPKNEDRNIKLIQLKNGIKCILIQDTHLDKSYIISAINIGSLANKLYTEGIAHLLEHMCFITSEKYKVPNYLSNKISEYGGSTNAYTDTFQTIYYLNIYTKHLEEILETFIDFLYNAELKEEYILNEIKNVHSEHLKNINSDSWRLFSLKHLIANPDSNYNSFFTGSNDSFTKDIKKTLYDIQNFYKKYYILNNISFGIISNLSIEELEKLVEKKIDMNIKKEKNNGLPPIINKPFYSKNQSKIYFMKAVSNMKLINYLFETDDAKNYLSNKIFKILGHLLNSSRKGFINDKLKTLGYINYLAANYEDEGVFNITISLTDSGYNNLNTINGMLIYTINFLFKQNWNDIVDYYKKHCEFLFNNSEKKNTLDLGLELTSNIHIFDDNKLYSGNYLIEKYSKNSLEILKKYIDFNNVIKIIVSNTNIDTKKFNWLIDSQYKTEYIELPHDFISNEIIKYDIVLNLSNEYHDLKPKYIPGLKNKTPKAVPSENKIQPKLENKIWFGNTSKFNEPIVYINIIFNDTNYFNTIRNSILMNLITYIINYTFDIELSDAFELNYGAHLGTNRNLNQLVLNIFVYNDKAQKFIDKVLDLFFTKARLPDKIILSFIESYKESLMNIIHSTSWEYADYILSSVYDNFYNNNLMLEELNKIKIDDIYKFIDTYLNKSNCCIFVYGNIEKNFKFDKLDLYLNREYQDFPKVNMKNISITHPNEFEKNNCIFVMYNFGKFKPKKILHLLFIDLIYEQIFYNKMRVEKQLGYLVSLNSGKIGNDYYLFQKIQSETEMNELEKYINQFNKDMIPDVDLNIWKKTVENMLLEKKNNIYELFIAFNNEIANREYLFKRNKKLLSCIDKVTNESLSKYIKKYLLNNEFKYVIKIKKN